MIDTQSIESEHISPEEGLEKAKADLERRLEDIEIEYENMRYDAFAAYAEESEYYEELLRMGVETCVPFDEKWV